MRSQTWGHEFTLLFFTDLNNKDGEHLVFCCPGHNQARKDTWPGDQFMTDLQCLWSFLERNGAVTPPPPTGNEREDIGLIPQLFTCKKFEFQIP